MNDLPGSPFGPGGLLARRYRLEGLLGEGGFGRVYRAFDQKLERLVALKVLTVSADRPERGERVQRFEEEARAIAKLDHPHIVPVYDAGTEGPLPWMVMKLIDGPDLRTLLREEGPFAPPRALLLLLQIGKALAHAHQSGIVHRDVKPANILLAQRNGDEHAWLTDFGIAKILTGFELTLDGRILGTPSYMSPEQAIGKLVDVRADIFALGCVAAELVTGRPAFQGDSVTEILQAILYGAPDLDGLRERAGRRFELAVERCLAKSPLDRWQTLGDLLEELEGLTLSLNGSSYGPRSRWENEESLPTLREDALLPEPGTPTAPPTGKPLPATPWYQRHRLVVPLLAALLGLAGLLASGWLRPPVWRAPSPQGLHPEDRVSTERPREAPLSRPAPGPPLSPPRPETGAPSPSPALLRVIVLVLDDATEERLPGARVLSDEEGGDRETDSEGRCTMAVRADLKRLRITVSKAGYKGQNRDIDVFSGMDPVRIRLVRANQET